jgi:hypothetical protein
LPLKIHALRLIGNSCADTGKSFRPFQHVMSEADRER